MKTRIWKVYGFWDISPQEEAYSKSFKYDWSDDGKIRILEVLNSDKTGTTDYAVVKVTRNTADECEKEICGQVWDGIFENFKTGSAIEIDDQGNGIDVLKI